MRGRARLADLQAVQPRVDVIAAQSIAAQPMAQGLGPQAAR
jgi:hypothetical protein